MDFELQILRAPVNACAWYATLKCFIIVVALETSGKIPTSHSTVASLLHLERKYYEMLTISTVAAAAEIKEENEDYIDSKFSCKE